MDEMKIKSVFMKKLISDWVNQWAMKQLGIPCDLLLDVFHLTNDGTDTVLNLGVTVRVKTKDLPEAISNFAYKNKK